MDIAEKTCPRCAETVKAEAKVCRHCGYDFETGASPDVRVGPVPPETAKGSKLGKGCLIAIGVLVVLIAIGAIVGDGEDDLASATGDVESQAAAPLEVTARELAAAYDANEVAAQQTYGGQRLAVTGTVDGITLDFMDNSVVQLVGVNQFLAVQATLEEGEDAASLSKGATATVICEEVTEVISAPMLSGCRLAS